MKPEKLNKIGINILYGMGFAAAVGGGVALYEADKISHEPISTTTQSITQIEESIQGEEILNKTLTDGAIILLAGGIVAVAVARIAENNMNSSILDRQRKSRR